MFVYIKWGRMLWVIIRSLSVRCHGCPSACGKNSLMDVMLGLLNSESGKVIIGGIDADELGESNYWNQIAAVMQYDQLLLGSIADKICFFEPQFEQNRLKFVPK